MPMLFVNVCNPETTRELWHTGINQVEQSITVLIWWIYYMIMATEFTTAKHPKIDIQYIHVSLIFLILIYTSVTEMF